MRISNEKFEKPTNNVGGSLILERSTFNNPSYCFFTLSIPAFTPRNSKNSFQTRVIHANIPHIVSQQETNVVPSLLAMPSKETPKTRGLKVFHVHQCLFFRFSIFFFQNYILPLPLCVWSWQSEASTNPCMLFPFGKKKS